MREVGYDEVLRRPGGRERKTDRMRQREGETETTEREGETETTEREGGRKRQTDRQQTENESTPSKIDSVIL